MIKYKVVLNKIDSIELDLLGRKKLFIKDQEVQESAYTKSYPQYFKRVGEEKGYDIILAKPIFIPDPIIDFVTKEEERQKITKKYITIEEEEIPKIDNELQNAISEFLTEYSDDFDVKIETQE